MDEADPSNVLRSFTIKACPPAKPISKSHRIVEGTHKPIGLLLPGSTCTVVTPPAAASRYPSSCVLRPSIALSQGKIGPFVESKSTAPEVKMDRTG